MLAYICFPWEWKFSTVPVLVCRDLFGKSWFGWLWKIFLSIAWPSYSNWSNGDPLWDASDLHWVIMSCAVAWHGGGMRWGGDPDINLASISRVGKKKTIWRLVFKRQLWVHSHQWVAPGIHPNKRVWLGMHMFVHASETEWRVTRSHVLNQHILII